MEAISQAGAAVGILAKDGVVFAAEKRVTSKLLDVRKATEKLYKVDDHIALAAAGITADAIILLNYARQAAQQYFYLYQEPMPLEQLLQVVCDLKHGYTQSGGLRPFGVSFLVGGWDDVHGFQLYQSDPSGNYSGWKARAIGANHASAQSTLKSDYWKASELTKPESERKKDDEKAPEIDETTGEKPELKDALMLAIKVLSKTMDTTSPTKDKIEISTITKTEQGKVVYHVYTKDEVAEVLQKAEVMLAEARKKQELESAGETTGDI